MVQPSRTPARARLVWWLVLTALGVGLAHGGWLLSTGRGLGNVYDEGVMASGADRVLRGEAPYRDFWTVYAPAQFYVLAAALRWAGRTLLAIRLLGVLQCALLAAAVAWGVARHNRWVALASGTVVMLWVLAFCPCGSALVPALLWLVLASIAATSGTSRRRSAVVAAGACVGLAGWFRHDVAVIGGGALMVAMMLQRLAERNHIEEGTAASRRQPVLHLVLFLLGVVGTGGWLLVWLTRLAPAHELFDCLVRFPLATFPHVRRIDYPPLRLVTAEFAIVPLLLIAGGTLLVGRALRAARTASAVAPNGLALAWALMGCAGLARLSVRPDEAHLVMAAVFLLGLAGLSRRLATVPLPVRAAAGPGKWVGVAVGLALLLCLLKPLSFVGVELAGRHSRTRAIGPVAAHRLLVTEEEQAILNVVREVQSLTRPDERLYVGTVRHDQLVIADTLFGFLANRRPATYYHELHPGLTTTRTVQERILRALATEDVRCIVLVDLEANAVNEGPGGQGVTHLDDTIRSRFLSIGSAYPPYQLWWRKDAGPTGRR